MKGTEGGKETMQAKVIRFTRPDERLMRPQEAAERMARLISGMPGR